MGDSSRVPPDFQAMAQHHTGLARELSRCENLPSMQQDNAILRELQMINQNLQGIHSRITNLEVRMGNLESRMESLENRMGGLENRVDGLENRVGGLENRVGGLEQQIGEIKTLITTSNNNNVVRLHNSQVVKQPNYGLMPLHSVLTNEAIRGFPKTPNDIEQLTEPAITNILQALRASTDGNVPEKRQRLRMQCGLPKDSI